jgi:hypothetical protein
MVICFGPARLAFGRANIADPTRDRRADLLDVGKRL